MTLLLARWALPLLVWLSVGGCSGESTAEHAPLAPPPTVRLIHVAAAAAFDQRRFVGRVEPRSSVDLAFQLAGQIVDLPVREGELIERGGRIAALDPADFELALARADASLVLARAEHDRARDLFKRSAVSQSRLDEVVADLKLAEVALQTARRNRALTLIEAPFPALIARRLVDAYTFVSPGTPVVRVQDVTELRVRISLPEDLIGLARDPRGFTATARLAALPETSFPLELREFVTEADRVAQTFEVSLAISGPRDPRVLPGMTATVELRAATPNGVQPPVLVPLSAIDTSGATEARVWVYEAVSGRVEPRQVVPGLPEGDQVPIRAGLLPGERIVAIGVQHLHAGQAVRPFEP